MISLVIPMYNESKIIKDTALTLDKYMQENFESYELIFANDGSTDNCAQIVSRLGLDNVRVVGYEKNRGKGCAIRCGVLSSVGDVVMFTDADLAYGTDVIKRAYDIMQASPQTGMLIGSRNLKKDGYDGYTALRKLMSKVYIKLLCMMGGFSLSDSQCGCKAFSKDAAHSIFKKCRVDGFAFDFEVISWAQELGVRIEEMPVKIINHRESTVRVFSDSIKMINDVRRIKKSVRKQARGQKEDAKSI